MIMLQCHKVSSGGLLKLCAKIELLKQDLQVAEVAVKRDIPSLAGEKGLEDLYHTTYFFGWHTLSQGFARGSMAA